MINIRTKLLFKTESGNVLDKLRARSIELRKDQQKKNGNNIIQPKFQKLPRNFNQLNLP